MVRRGSTPSVVINKCLGRYDRGPAACASLHTVALRTRRLVSQFPRIRDLPRKGCTGRIDGPKYEWSDCYIPAFTLKQKAIASFATERAR